MITTTEIFQTIPKLPQKDCFQIAEILLQRLLTQTKPTPRPNQPTAKNCCLTCR
ncbi:hypothetical protein [Pseudanabaena sp. UWO310]|uniref:hypothetical protein n=1 Tax=Pseudanabaena sp. UWO310 TaxID=2480795 RepID=UPI001680DC5F|nr:hypothetical protein [Pseudanabaena sp. UWO310]